jgi:apolipoprotein N-acyltransferase
MKHKTLLKRPHSSHAQISHPLIGDLSLILVGALLGLTWGFDHLPFAIASVAIFPVVLFFCPKRITAFAYALAYFLVASRGIPHGAGIFFETTSNPMLGWLLWAGAGILNALPWAWAWIKTRDPFVPILRVCAAVVITTLPPIGLVGWVSPLSAAGWLYPGLGLIGLGLLFLMWSGLIAKSLRVSMFCAAIAVGSNISYSPASNYELNGMNFVGIDTQFSKLQSKSYQHISSRLNLITELSKKVPDNTVVVLPETMLPAPDFKNFGFVEAILENAGSTLNSKNSVIIFGREFPTESGSFENTLVFLGHQKDPLKQRIPVPFGMWKPWAFDSFEMNIFGSGATSFAGLKMGFLICYEQTLTITNLGTMINHPDLVIASANDWWAKGTSIPNIQAQTSLAWTRLFGVPFISAVNY